MASCLTEDAIRDSDYLKGFGEVPRLRRQVSPWQHEARESGVAQGGAAAACSSAAGPHAFAPAGASAAGTAGEHLWNAHVVLPVAVKRSEEGPFACLSPKMVVASSPGVGGLPAFDLDTWAERKAGAYAAAAARHGTGAGAGAAAGAGGGAVAGDGDAASASKRKRRSAPSPQHYRNRGSGAAAWSGSAEAGSGSEDASDDDTDKTESDCEEEAAASAARASERAAGPKPAKRSRKDGEAPSKSLTFCDSVKEHDGLCRTNEILDTLVWDFFSTGRVACVDDVGRVFGSDFCLFPAVLALIDDLADRIACSLRDIPVLPRGGGSAAKLSTIHLSNLLQLRELVAVASDLAGYPATHLGEEEEGTGFSCSDEEAEAAGALAPSTSTADLELEPVSASDLNAAGSWDASAASCGGTDALDALAAAASTSDFDGVTVDVLGLGPEDGVSYEM